MGFNETHEYHERVFLVGVWETTGGEYSSEDDFRHSMNELYELSCACYMEPVGQAVQQLRKVNSALYVGSGKAEEIRERAGQLEVSWVIFNDTLTPSQIRNLQKVLKKNVMDRTALILEIFEKRARTREAKLQVELAKLQYLKPRLIGMWETQNRQGGASGSMSSKGEGETQLEIDRRTIDHRLAELRKELKVVIRERETQRKKRRNSGVPMAALVGYTNAGKSTIMNALVSRYSEEEKKVFEADMLFATLDTTVRRIEPGKGKEFLLSDTVGFIHKLPTGLVEAFKSTLEEAGEADLLLQIVDCSDEHCREHIAVTNETLKELGAGHIPMITVYNKADLCDPQVIYPRAGMRVRDASNEFDDSIYISAKDENSIDMLVETVTDKLFGRYVGVEMLIPYSDGSAVSEILKNAQESNVSYLPEGTLVKARCHFAVAEKFAKYNKN